MSRLDDLPPDQRAALSLLLSQGKDYAEVAALLHIGERAVHDRAQAALAVLAPREARELTPERREEIGDYLLGQRAELGDRLRTRSLLDGSPPAQAWARALAAELAPLAARPLPEIPDGVGPRGDAGASHRAEGDTQPAARAPGLAQRASGGSQLPTSRRGGAILLGAIAVVAIAAVLIVVLATGGGSHSRAAKSAGSAAASTSAGSSGPATPKASETRRIALTPPNGGSSSLGVAAVLQEGNTYAFYLAAEKLAPSNGFFYAVWLYNSPTSYEALSKSPPVKADGRLQGGSLLPADAYKYHQMIVTTETSERPTRPGPVVLRGSFGLH
jgi:Sigma-70, region 4